MKLKNAKSLSQNLNTINSNNSKTLFSLFFTDLILNRIVRYTNLNAEKVRVDPVVTRAKNVRFHDSHAVFRSVVPSELARWFNDFALDVPQRNSPAFFRPPRSGGRKEARGGGWQARLVVQNQLIHASEPLNHVELFGVRMASRIDPASIV